MHIAQTFYRPILDLRPSAAERKISRNKIVGQHGAGDERKPCIAIAGDPAKKQFQAVRPFVFYSLRHTFLIRLSESGCDVLTLERIAGLSQIEILFTENR